MMIAAMAVGAMTPSAIAVEISGASSKKRTVFGTSERQARTQVGFQKWHGMLGRHRAQLDQAVREACESSWFARCPFKDWDSFLKEIRNDSLMDKIKLINGFANRVRYIDDMRNYRLSDFWATPLEFLKNRGDCEDYAITKYLSLKALGIPVEDMRIVVLKDTNIREHHAILIVDVNGFQMVLDNQTDYVVEDRLIRHYAPIYSLNEQGAWFHTR